MGMKIIISENQKKGLYRLFSEQATQTKPQGTKIDGIIGEFTSKFIFPKKFMVYLNSGDVKNLGIEGNSALLSIAQNNKLTTEQMNEWNKFQQYLQTNGQAGNKNMNNIEYSNKWLQAYTKAFPNFWVKTAEDIKKVQNVMQVYRAYVIKDFEACTPTSSQIRISGKQLNCKNPNDVSLAQKDFMTWAKPGSIQV